jgi:hypothetical protein
MAKIKYKILSKLGTQKITNGLNYVDKIKNNFSDLGIENIADNISSTFSSKTNDYIKTLNKISESITMNASNNTDSSDYSKENKSEEFIRNDIEIKIGECFENCPSCKSDDWKSAKMIALSSISKTSGNLSGSAIGISELLGILAGNFFTADHWFSKKSQMNMDLNLDVNLTTTGSLLEELKLLMLSYESITKMPEMPIEPNKIGFFDRIIPVEPQKPIEPKKIELPELPANQAWYIHYKNMIIDAGIFVIFLAIIIGFIKSNFMLGTFIGLILWIAASILSFPLSFFQNKKNLKKHDELLKIIPIQYEKELENYKAALKNYEKNFQIYLIGCDKAEKQKINEEKSFATYKKNYDKYITQKNKVLKIRELLWHRARLCMRCGTAYISPPK